MYYARLHGLIRDCDDWWSRRPCPARGPCGGGAANGGRPQARLCGGNSGGNDRNRRLHYCGKKFLEDKSACSKGGPMKIVAVTACPTGIAHTYMAAARLEKTAQDLGYEIKIETQGALGIENPLSVIDIPEAQTAIFAVHIRA